MAPAMVRDAIKYASVFNEEIQEFGEVLREIAGERGEINRRKLGWWIRRNSGRIVNGRRFVRASGHRSAEAWQIEVIESVSSVLSVCSGGCSKVASSLSTAIAAVGVNSWGAFTVCHPRPA